MSDSESDDQYRSKVNRRRRRIIEDDDDEDDVIQDEEEEEGEDQFEKDGFLVSDEEADEEESEKPRKKSKRRKRNMSEEELDEDDFDLIKENAGISFDRPEPKLKRLQKKIYSEDEEQYSEDLDQEQGYSNRDALGGMFDDEEDAGGEIYSGDDLDDFIEHDGMDNAEEDQDEDPKAREARLQLLRKRRQEESRMLRGSGGDSRSHDLVLEIFGDGTDYEYAMQEPASANPINDEKSVLQSAFGPGEIEAGALAEKDVFISQLDVPERMQELYARNVENRSKDYTAEFEWVIHCFEEGSSTSRISELLRNPSTSSMARKAIKSCVNFFNAEFLEAPFIWHYRKDYLLSAESTLYDIKTVMELDDVWEVFDMDRKYKAFSEQRAGFEKTFRALEAEGRTDAYVHEYRKSIKRSEDAQDILDYIAAHFKPPEQPSTAEGQRMFRRPNSNSLLDRCKRAKLEGLMEEIGMTPMQFGINALESKKVHRTRNPPYPPTEAALKYCSMDFKEADHVLHALRILLPYVLFHDLSLRQSFRNSFEDHAAISVVPTARGRREIDSQHRFFPFKYITEKKLINMQGALFLQMMEAESLGLVTVQLSLSNEVAFIDNLKRLYLHGDSSNPIHAEWDKLRGEIINYACKEYLFPYFKSWTRDRLRVKAEEFLFKACLEQAQLRFNMAPYRPPHLDATAIPRVIALTNGGGGFRDPLIAVFLESNGQLEGTVEFGDLRDQANRDLLRNFFESHPCDAIVVSGLNLNARYFVDKVRQVYQEAQTSPALCSAPPCEVFMHTDEVARIYQASKLAEEEFPKLHPSARYCISLARLLQDPLVEYASLREGITNLSFHPLQNLLPKEELSRAIERALVNVVNAVGIDLNRAVHNDRVGYLLRYVSGLGPCKAQYILNSIAEKGGVVESRNQLITDYRVGMRDFINASGFILIKPAIDVLDITRIHPEDYGLARKMAVDSTDVDDEEDDPSEPSRHVRELLRRNQPDMLNNLDLEDYSRLLSCKFQTGKHTTLNLIKTELRGPYADPRPHFAPTSAKTIFEQLTGETEESLSIRSIVPAQIRRQVGRGVICQLNSGVDGFLANPNIPNPDMIREGEVIQCAVTSINYERFQVELSLLPHELDACRQRTKVYFAPFGGGIDKQFDHLKLERELIENPAMYPNFPRPTPTVANPMTANPLAERHSLYQPLTFKEAESFLGPRQIGEVVLRPSSLGANHIALTWKFYDKFFQHLDLTVIKREPDPSATWDALPVQVQVGDTTYGDLDELLANHIEAMKNKVIEMIHHPKFHKGSLEQLEEAITAASLTNPKQSIYGFCVSTKTPGGFALGFKLSAKSRFEMWAVRVIPRQFRLNHVTFSDVASLITGFKKMITTMASSRLNGQNPGATPRAMGYNQPMTGGIPAPQPPARGHVHPSRASQMPGGPPRNPAYR